jgi:outer membrane protein OmpA-like peptidoglycan-associated protein
MNLHDERASTAARRRSTALRLSLAAGVLIAASGCAPRQNRALQDARLAYSDARSDPTVVEYASVPLQEAGVTLERAEAKYRAGDQREVGSLAYISQQEVAKARAIATERQAQQLSAAGDDVVVAARVEEADVVVAQLSALEARETAQGLALTVRDVFFETGRAELKPSALGDLARVASFLREYPDRNVVIEGHTDSRGSDGHNAELSQRRAASVRSYLIAQGVAPSRLLSQGFGESYPMASNDSDAGRQQNRRVEMLVLNPGQVASSTATPIIVR